MRLVFIILIVSFIPLSTIGAQNPSLSFERISTLQGLSQNTVNSILQDNRGFLWIGTRDGLNRYDGYRFAIYKNDPSDTNSISDNYIQTLHKDKEGRLWTGSAHLDCFDPETGKFRHFRHDPRDSSSLSSENVWAICEDSSGNIWIGTDEGGINMYNKLEGILHRLSSKSSPLCVLNDASIIAICADADDCLWIGTSPQGLYRYHLSSDKLENYRNGESGFTGSTIFSIALQENGDVWVGTRGNGLYRFDRPSGHFRNYQKQTGVQGTLSDNSVRTVYCDRRGTVWVGTENGGLNRYNPSSDDFTSFQYNPYDNRSISSNFIYAVYMDDSGNLWVGTSGGGICKYSPFANKFSYYRLYDQKIPDITSNNVLSVYGDTNDVLWLGTNGGGLIRFDRRFQKYTVFKNDPERKTTIGNNSIYAIRRDHDGRLWIGTRDGLNLYHDDSYSFTVFRNEKNNPHSLSYNRIWCLLEDRRQQLWIGTVQGLNRLDQSRRTFIRYLRKPDDSLTLSDNRIRVLYEDHRGKLWIGTGHGLNEYDPVTDRFRRFVKINPDDSSGLPDNDILSVCEYPDGTLWIATPKGIGRLDLNTYRFAPLTTPEGLTRDMVYGILSDNMGCLWISSNHGISKYNLISGAINKYDIHDGLLNVELNQGAHFQSASGEMFFGGSNGLSFFYPKNIINNPKIPSVQITGFKKFYKDSPLKMPVYALDALELTYHDYIFSLEFSALDFSIPDKNRYAYMLEGFDENWIDAGQVHVVTYTDLNPGDYIFRVKGSNCDGIWSDQYRALSVIIQPPFWQTWWFRTLAILTALTLIAGFYEYRLKKMLEIERTRSRIARDLHDEVGGTLSSISYFAQAIRQEADLHHIPVPVKFLSLITESASDAQESISDIIWSIDPANDCWETLFAKFRRFASDLIESRNINYSTEFPTTLSAHKLGMEQRRNFWMLYKEMITNAVKHSEATFIHIRITFKNDFLCLSVSDNGKGFDPGIQNEQHGINNLHARASLLKGELKLSTSPGNGAHWTFIFKPS